MATTSVSPTQNTTVVDNVASTLFNPYTGSSKKDNEQSASVQAGLKSAGGFLAAMFPGFGAAISAVLGVFSIAFGT